MKRAFGYFAMGLAGALLALGGHDMLSKRDQTTATVATAAPPVRYVNLPNADGSSTSALDFTYAAESTLNAVVHVTTETAVNVRDPFADFFWGYRAPQQQQLRQGAGSGVIISNDGYIVTNNHVIDGADKIQVHLNDRRAFEGKVIGRDTTKDLATVPYGNSDDVRVGEWVLAVGNPMNLTSTVTAGIVSAKARNINLLQYDAARDIIPLESFIQTDAAVNPGNSGGALVDANGQLVGINSAIASTTGAYSGYSFAIPSNIVRKVANDLLEFGSVQRAYIGVSIRDMDQKLADEVGLGKIKGVYVNGITDGGAAQKAGMQQGDVIMKVGNIEVNNVPQLQEQVGKFRPGHHVPVTVYRKGKEQVFDMTLRGKEGTTVAAVETRSFGSASLGAEFGVPSTSELKSLGLEHGVKVTTINGGKFRSSGIKEGFIITRIDQEPIKDPGQLAKLLENKRGGVLVEGVYPNGTRAYYGLGL
ncbi:MAG TPA: trypsin-like peptidase domain-containing protein [Flavobacteriales bacterium]|nr:trypsin-like peptidase domain-containing protein [Flavobacteriales bacterium]